jgi:hypothetical protein
MIVQLSGVKLLSTSLSPAIVSSIICLPIRCSIEDSSCRLTKSELVAPNMASTTAPIRSPSTPMIMRPCSGARSAMPASITSGRAETAESWLITPLTQLSSWTGQRMRCESEKAIFRMMMSDRLSIKTDRSCGVSAEASKSIALVSSDSSTNVMMFDRPCESCGAGPCRPGHAPLMPIPRRPCGAATPSLIYSKRHAFAHADMVRLTHLFHPATRTCRDAARLIAHATAERRTYFRLAIPT